MEDSEFLRFLLAEGCYNKWMDWKRILKFKKMDMLESLCLVVVIGMIIFKFFSAVKSKEPVKGDFYYHPSNDHFDSKRHYETEGAGRSIFLNR